MSPVDYEVTPPSRFLLVFPVLVGVAAPLGMLVAMLTQAKTPIPWPALALAALLPFAGIFMAWVMFRRRIRLSDEGLRIRSLPWPRTVPAAQIDLDAAEIVDLRARRELMPFLKIAGSRMPGYRSGRFRLRDKRKASVLLTDLARVLVLPLRDGSLVMLSLERPESLLQALRRRA